MRQLRLRTSRPNGERGSVEVYTHYKGMPMVAMDGDKFKLPDTPANAEAFGRPTTSREQKILLGGYPQMHLNRLMAVGTRLCIDAIIKPCNTNDHTTAPGLLKSVRPGELVLWDCGFYSFELMDQALLQPKQETHSVFEAFDNRFDIPDRRAHAFKPLVGSDAQRGEETRAGILPRGDMGAVDLAIERACDFWNLRRNRL